MSAQRPRDTHLGQITWVNQNDGSSIVWIKELNGTFNLSRYDYPKNFIPHDGQKVVVSFDARGRATIMEGIEYG